MIAADLIRRGYRIAIPYGEDWDFDLIVCREGRLERVQCKYSTSNGIYITVRCRSHSLTNGKGEGDQALHRRDDRLACGLRPHD
jgi:hypothetical protein